MDNYKYIIVMDENHPPEEIVNLFNVPRGNCCVVPEEFIAGRSTGSLIVLRWDDYGKIKLDELKVDAVFWLIPCWFYPETAILHGQNLFHDLLLAAAIPLSGLVSRVIMALTGREVSFKVKFISYNRG